MSLEACATLGWPYTGIAQRLNKHPSEFQKLSRFRAAIEAIIAIGIQPIHRVLLDMGIPIPIICTPEEMVGDD